MDMMLVNAIAVFSMVGIAFVGIAPAAIGAGMAALFVLGMADGPLGGRLDGSDKTDAQPAGRKAA